MRWLVALMLVLSLAGLARADYIDLVKQTKNSLGLYCAEIPRVVENKLGFKEIFQNWLGAGENGSYNVFLKLTFEKEVITDGVYMSYRWKPEYVWAVNRTSRDVTPLNALARDWMVGKI